MAPEEARRALEEIARGARAHDLESETLDFKEQPKVEDQAIRDILDAALCFANASGGVVVVGVANKVSGPAAFSGCTLDSDFVRKRVYELSVPPLLVDVLVERVAENRSVLL